jgi:hypothetical protein
VALDQERIDPGRSTRGVRQDVLEHPEDRTPFGDADFEVVDIRPAGERLQDSAPERDVPGEDIPGELVVLLVVLLRRSVPVLLSAQIVGESLVHRPPSPRIDADGQAQVHGLVVRLLSPLRHPVLDSGVGVREGTGGL